MRNPLQLASLQLRGLSSAILLVLQSLLVDLLLPQRARVQQSYAALLNWLDLVLLGIASLVVLALDPWVVAELLDVLLLLLLLIAAREMLVDRVLDPSEAEAAVKNSTAVFFVSLPEPGVLVQLS